MPPETTLEAPPQTERAPSPALADFDSTFADLDTPPTPPPNEPTPPPSPAPETKSTPPKDPATGKFTKTETVVPKTEGEGAKASPPVPEKTQPPTPAVGEYSPPQVVKPTELKRWAQNMGSRAEKAEQQIVQLNRQIKELRSQPQQNADVQATVAELAAYKKRYEDAQAEIKATRYERSDEYKDKYEKPYQNAWQNAYSVVGELLVSQPDPSNPENVLERPATKQDFDEIYDLKLGPGSKLARQKFGDAAPLVMQHVQSIKDLARAAVASVNENRGKAQAFEQQQTAQQKVQEEGRLRMFNEAVGSIFEKHKEAFGEPDPQGKAIADMAFGDRSQLTPTQSATLDAHVYARLSWFPTLKAERDSFKAKLAERDKELAEIRGSAPGKPAPSAPKPDKSMENLSMEAAFDRDVPP